MICSFVACGLIRVKFRLILYFVLYYFRDFYLELLIQPLVMMS